MNFYGLYFFTQLCITRFSDYWPLSFVILDTDFALGPLGHFNAHQTPSICLSKCKTSIIFNEKLKKGQQRENKIEEKWKNLDITFFNQLKSVLFATHPTTPRNTTQHQPPPTAVHCGTTDSISRHFICIFFVTLLAVLPVRPKGCLSPFLSLRWPASRVFHFVPSTGRGREREKEAGTVGVVLGAELQASAAANSSSSQHASVSRAKDTINVFRGRPSRRQRVLFQCMLMALPTQEKNYTELLQGQEILNNLIKI